MGMNVYRGLTSHGSQPIMSTPLRAVTFDLWETLMHDTPASGERRRKLRISGMRQALATAGIKATAASVSSAYDGVWRWLESDWWARQADPGFEAQFDWLVRRLDVDSQDPELLARLRMAYVDSIFESPPQAYPAALPLLEELRKRGLRLGLICNTSVTPGSALRQLLDGWGLGQLLDTQLYSDELGIRKPAPAVFQEAATRLGVQISELLHVGDRPDVDRDGALAAGALALLVGAELPLERVGATIAAQLNIRPSGQGAA
jgi:HAD superfamily hydrolase (TIGR01549 family)